MCCKNFRQRVFPFAATIMLGIFVASFFLDITILNAKQMTSTAENERKQEGRGSGIGSGTAVRSETNSFQIISKPQAAYTAAARQNQVQGTVLLRVNFLASGKIGNISRVRGLPNGLTEKAVEAAKRIKFKPAIENGKPVKTIKTLEYIFTLY